MGQVYGTVESKKSHAITAKMKKEFNKRGEHIRLLLLGTGESGKSTLLKQMRNLYGKRAKVSEDELMLRRASVFQTVLTSMAALLKASDHYTPLANPDLLAAKEKIIAKNKGGARSSFSLALNMTKELREDLIALWNDEGVRKTWENHRSEIQAQESLQYFMSDADRVLHQNFGITEMDWLRARVRTTGVITESFVVRGLEFTVIDVGGQRNERKKWIHVFSGVTAVIFVCAINEYDQRLFEDEQVNRLQESLDEFEKIVNNEEFLESGMILFLNKDDLFQDKLTKMPIAYKDPSDMSQDRWADFQGPDAVGVTNKDCHEFEEAYDAGIDYFTQKFAVLNRHPSTKDIYVHITNAMDKRNVDAVLGACWDMILKRVLSRQGFIRD